MIPLIIIFYTLTVIGATLYCKKHIFISKKFHPYPVKIVYPDKSWMFLFLRIMIISDIEKIHKNINS